MLLCENGSLYTGYTVEPEKRFNEHLNSKAGARFTKSFRPVAIAACWKVEGTRGSAMRLEAFIKRQSTALKRDFARSPLILTVMAEESLSVKAAPVSRFIS